MAAPDRDRQKRLREEIRKTSRNEFILKEMKRLGLWPEDQEEPKLTEALIKRKGELSREIHELAKKNQKYQNKEATLNRIKKERLLKSREQQKLNKQKKKEEREAKLHARAEEMKRDITYIGKRYSHQLKDKECDLDRLAQNNLPPTKSLEELAQLLNVTVNDLRFLSYDRRLNKISHYVSYGIKKKSGGVRKISAPKPKLKFVQRAILDNLLSKLNPSKYAHGFVPNKSIVTNALPHIGSSIIINMDLKDFFPSIDYKRVYGFFKSLGYSPQISTVLALICTIPDEQPILVHGQKWHINNGHRTLPQGAPTSPMITNLICRKMDRRMAGIANKLGFTYTRYADDMTFSGPKSSRANIQKLKWQTHSVIKDEDLQLHPDKTKVMPNGHRKEVTGLVVNKNLNVPRKKLKAFRALLFQIEKDGLAGKTWGNPEVDLLYSIEGFAKYIYMVNPEKGKQYLNQVNRIINKHRPKPKGIFGKKKTPQQGSKPWWKFW